MPRKKDKTKTKLRVSTIVKKMGISPHLAAAVTVKHNLKNSDLIEPDKFRDLVDNWLKQPVGGN